MSDPKTWYALEDFDNHYLPAQTNILALTPWVCHELDSADSAYHIFDHHGVMSRAIQDQDKLIHERMYLFIEMDKMIQKKMPFCAKHQIHPTYFHHSRFSYVTDTLILFARLWRQFFSRFNPSEIVYVSRSSLESNESYSIHNFLNLVPLLRYYVLKQLCLEAEVVLRRVRIPAQESVKKKTFFSPRKILKSSCIRKHVKPLIDIFRYRKSFFKRKGSSKSKNKILFLNPGTLSISLVIEDALREGQIVYVFDRGEIRQTGRFGEKRSLSSKLMPKDKKEVLKGLDQLRLSDAFKSIFLNWINYSSGVDLTPVATKFLQEFLDRTLPDYLCLTQSFSEILTELDIDHIMSRGSTGKVEVAALTAPKLISKKIYRDTFQHSVCCYDLGLRYAIDELSLFDRYFATDSLSQNYFESYRNKLPVNQPEIMQSSHYFQQLKRKNFFVKTTNSKPLICYVPKKLAHGSMRFRSSGILIHSFAYYYHFQKALLDYFFSQKDRFDFIYKHVPSQKWVEKSTFAYMRQKSISNVKVVDGDLLKVYQKSDRVILDYPSTGFFEALQMKLPTLALCSNLLELAPKYKEYFGCCLAGYGDEAEGLLKVSQFLDSDAQVYIRDLSVDFFQLEQVLKN